MVTHIRITHIPAGEAPDWVRPARVGAVLPVSRDVPEGMTSFHLRRPILLFAFIPSLSVWGLFSPAPAPIAQAHRGDWRSFISSL